MTSLAFAEWWASSEGEDVRGAHPARFELFTPHPSPSAEWSATAAADRACFERVIGGDEAAMAQLFHQFARSLERVAFSVVRSRDVARDAVQTVFTTLWHRRAQATVPDDVAAYLHRSVYRAAQNIVRTERREEARRVSQHHALPGATTPVTRTPEQTLADAELTAIVRDAIAGLPGRSGEIFRLLWTGQLSYEQISVLTGISIKGVEKARARALHHLRDALGGYWP
jgi:RNA polymerase sigma-70 factor (ECF subfamily)